MRLNFRRGSAFASKKAINFLKDKKPEDFKNITVIRHAAIGDFMNIRPFLINAREFFPNAKITLSVDRNAMYGYPEDLIDELHIIDKRDPKTKKRYSIFQRIRQIKKLPEQDIIFDLSDSTFTLLQIVFTNAKLKIGYPYRALRRLFFDMAVLRSDFVVEADSTQHMLYFLGSRKTTLEYGFENKYPKQLKNRVVYFPGASIIDKCWEYEKMGQLIDKMSAKYPETEHVILQGIGEDEKFLEIYEPLKNRKNIRLQETMSFDKVMQFMTDSRCVVANDTGIRNMALAVEVPTVGIFFATGAFRYWPKDERHICVFNEEYESPSVSDIQEATETILKLTANNF